MAENKITFGLKNAHYAKITVDNTGKITYATPKAIPGSTELSQRNLKTDLNQERKVFH